MVRYLLRFDDMAESRLAKKSLAEQKLDLVGNHWFNKTKLFLDKLGLSYIHSRGDKKSSEINRLSIVAKNRKNEMFEQLVKSW